MPKRKKKSTVADPQKKVKISSEEPEPEPTNPTKYFNIEHCKSWSVYKRHATRLEKLISAEHSDIPVLINTTKPRSKSFEVSYHDGEKVTEIWSGIKLGPPRRLKFVEDDDFVELLKEKMKWGVWVLWGLLYDGFSLNLVFRELNLDIDPVLSTATVNSYFIEYIFN